MIMRRSGGVLLAILLMSATSPGRVEGQDEAGARAAIAQLFEGMRTANPDIVRQLFAADARFAVLDDGDGDPSIGAVASRDGSPRSGRRTHSIWTVAFGTVESTRSSYSTTQMDGR